MVNTIVSGGNTGTRHTDPDARRVPSRPPASTTPLATPPVWQGSPTAPTAIRWEPPPPSAYGPGRQRRADEYDVGLPAGSIAIAHWFGGHHGPRRWHRGHWQLHHPYQRPIYRQRRWCGGPLVIQIGTEQMLVTAVSGNTAGGSAVTVVRGYNGTTAMPRMRPGRLCFPSPWTSRGYAIPTTDARSRPTSVPSRPPAWQPATPDGYQQSVR